MIHDLSAVSAEIQCAIAFLNHFAPEGDWQRSQLLLRWQQQTQRHRLTVDEVMRLGEFMRYQHAMVHKRIEKSWLAGHGKDETRVQTRLPL